MFVIVTLILSISVWELYNVGFEQQKNRLKETVQSRARMIEVIVEHERTHEFPDMDNARKVFLEKDVLAQIVLAHEHFIGFGDTGEFTLAKLDEGKIHFLLRHRHKSVDTTSAIPMEGKNAEPMRHALRGESGTLIGLDYRGAEVLAAYEPISMLGWGIVAKIDLEEIKKPYKIAISSAIASSFFLIILGSILFLRLTRPLIQKIGDEGAYNRMLFNESPIGLALCKMDGELVDINPAYAALIGRTVEETQKLSYWKITPEKYMDEEKEQLNKLLKKGQYGPYEKEYIHKDGHLVQVRLFGRIVEKDKQRYIWSSIEDISVQKRNEEALREASLVFEYTQEGILITDPYEKIIRINKAFTEHTGYTYDDVLGKTPRLLKTGKEDEQFYKKMWKTIMEDGYWYGEIWVRCKNGDIFPSLQTISAVKDEKGNVTAYLSVFSDITEHKAYEKKLAELANNDSLTALPNRMYFQNNLEQAIHIAKRNGYKLAVLFLDLNEFKQVNDNFGHDVGDQYLQAIAKRLQTCVREEDILARLGGDEFAIVLNGLDDIEIAISIAQGVIHNVSVPLEVAGNMFRPSVSIGISIYPEHGKKDRELLRAADKAMYCAKNRGRDQYAVYTLNPE